MITAGDFRNGVTFEMDGKVMQVIEFQHVKPGKGAAFVRTKMRNVITGGVTETSFNPTEKFENATVDRKSMEYSYADGDIYYFMDSESYELIPIDKSILSDSFRFVKENMVCAVASYKGNVFSVEAPNFVELEVTDTDPGFAGNTATNAVTINGDAVLADTTLLAMTKDGEPFESSPWLAPCASETTGDYLKGCVSILVNTTEGAPEVGTAPEGGESGELPEIQDKTDKVEFAAFSFLVNGTEVTNDTLKDLNIYKITVNVVNKSGESSESAYTGYKLADVLTACGVDSPTSVKIKANDGFESELAAELITSEYTLVAIEKDKETGEGGTIWVAPCSETSSSSYSKLVVEITAA